MSDVEQVPAVAFLRTDLLGNEQEASEYCLQQLSVRFGYAVREMVRVDASWSRWLVYLEDRIGVHAAEAVFVPTLVHLESQVERVIAQADVIEQDGSTYARWSSTAVLFA